MPKAVWISSGYAVAGFGRCPLGQLPVIRLISSSVPLQHRGAQDHGGAVPVRHRPTVRAGAMSAAPARRSQAETPAYFLVVGFLAVDEGWQHEPPAGLAELVLGLLAVIAGLVPVIAGLGVPFHDSIVFS